MGMNKVIVAGIVAEEPTFYSNSFYGNALEVKLDINRRDIDRVERLTCYIINDNLIDKGLNSIEVGDYLVCQSGRLVTLEFLRQKYMECPHCGEKSRRVRRATQTDILLYDFHLTKGISLENSVGINKVFMLGMVRSKVRTNDSFCKFQLIVNRPLGVETRLSESVPEGTTVESYDLPIVTCFKSVAEKVRAKTQKGDFVLAEGVLQERTARQKIPFRCKYCGNYSDQHFEYPVHEIIAASVTPQRMTVTDIMEQMNTGSLVNENTQEVSISRELDDTDAETAVQDITERVAKQTKKILERNANPNRN